MSIYKEFLGLNYCIYEPILDDEGAAGENVIGYSFASPLKYSDGIGSNPNISNFTSHDASKTMVLLNLHRNGPFGYPTWKQIRVSDNHLTRAQRRLNLFSYTEEPGPIINSKNSRFGETRVFKEPVVVDSYKPISLVGDINVYNDKLNVYQTRAVELKTSFGNETAFFANKEINENYDLIQETCEEYEQLKSLYLDGGLEDEGSPLDSFNLLVYRQSIFPRTEYSFLEETRTRKYFQNLFWRSDREDRHQENVDGGFDSTIPEESMWSLDVRKNFKDLTIPVAFVSGYEVTYPFKIGGFAKDNADNGPGILQNMYCSFTRGSYAQSPLEAGIPKLIYPTWPPAAPFSVSSHFTSSIEYSRLHTLKNIYSPLNPSGISLKSLEFLFDREAFTVDEWDAYYYSNKTGSIFNGRAEWDAPLQSGKEPFYDSYDLFSTETKIKGKSYSKVPEFRISNHVEHYSTNPVTEELKSIFELSGAFSENTTTEDNNFYKILSNSDFLNHFSLIKKDNKELSKESIITLKCKSIKKFIPYKGFYPAERTVEIAKRFYKSYKDGIKPSTDIVYSTLKYEDYELFSSKPLMTPLFSPGILFNTIKSGVAVDFPLIFTNDLRQREDEDDPGLTELYTFDFYDDREIEDLKGSFYLPGDLFPPSTAPGIITNSDLNNALIGHSKKSRELGSFNSTFSERIPFEALINPESYLSNKALSLQEPHPFGLSDLKFQTMWSGDGDSLYKKMISNFLAEVPDFFLSKSNFKTITSIEEQSPEFGNAISGSFYLMRIKMTKSRDKTNQMLGGYGGIQVMPPQDVVDQGPNFSLNSKFTTRETITMYSRPTAFGPPTIGDRGFKNFNGIEMKMGSTWGYNFPYTPPYYHGEAWCDLIFECKETKKYTIDEILSEVKEYPYYSRYWSPFFQDAMRDLTGYRNDSATTITVKDSSIYKNYDKSGWYNLIQQSGLINNIEFIAGGGGGEWLNNDDLFDFSTNTVRWASPSSEYEWKRSGPQSPAFLNYNAMQLNSSINLFGKGTVKTITSKDTGEISEVASGDTVRGKTRWIIQPKFESPILNFNKYNDLSDPDLKCTEPQFAKSQVPRGMWHQYGDLPKEDEGIFLKVEDVPNSWLTGALAIDKSAKKVKSLADLVGFSKDPVRLGEVADVKEISEAVVAVPFIEKDGTRQFFSIPREDIDSCIEASKREAAPGEFVAGGPPKAGDSVYQMVKKMKKYVFPPSMDFVKYKEIDPFAMYVFEFKHNLTKQDLADIWQNLPPDIGTRMEEAEATISHELLAHELLGGGSVVKNGVLDDNAEGNGIPSNIQWMIFKAKKRAKTNYFDKVVAKKGTTEDTSDQQLENAQGQTGDDKGITYNWPYDYFSLVELVKLDAEVTFANIENDDKGQKSIKKVERKNPLQQAQSRAEARGMNIARGKGKAKK